MFHCFRNPNWQLNVSRLIHLTLLNSHKICLEEINQENISEKKSISRVKSQDIFLDWKSSCVGVCRLVSIDYSTRLDPNKENKNIELLLLIICNGLLIHQFIWLFI